MNLRHEIFLRREDIYAICEQFGASNIRLFGSVARQEDRDHSDINFLVVLEPNRTLLDHAGLKLALERLLDRRVDISTEKGLKSKVRATILDHAEPL